MSGFPRYGNNLPRQSKVIAKLLDLEWDIVAPGHGHARDYRGIKDREATRAEEMKVAVDELRGSRTFA